MEYRNLGNSGLRVSLVGIGCNNFGARMDADAVQRVVDAALDHGINLFDTANTYGQGQSEELLGKALGRRRHEVVIATKFGNPLGEGVYNSGASRKYIVKACEDSLRRLGTDYIDLYQVHNPDPRTPIEETLRALDDLVRDGKVRYIGHSNFAGWQAVEAHYVAERHNLERFISAQNEYSLLNRRIERELVPACEKYGLGILPYFPLASGLLTGKYRRGEPPPEGTRLAKMQPMAQRLLTDRNWDIVEKLQSFAESRGHTLLELAFGWLATKPYISSVIAGATSPEQVAANVAAASWRLTPEEMAEVDEITRPGN